MKRILPLLALLGLAACEPQAVAGSGDAYVLALSWQPTFCESAARRPECRSQTPSRPDASQFSLHGLWPQPGSNVYCNVDRRDEEASKQGRWRDIGMERLSEPLWRRLQEGMPGSRSQLQRHEWIKHGTCMRGADAETYFRVSLDLLDAVNGSALGELFESNLGRNLTGAAIRAAADRDFGPGAGKRIRIACKDDGSRRIIGEITIGLKGDLLTAPLVREKVAALIAASPETDPGCPGGIVDRAGEQ